jgi:hypothetical protein
MPSPLVRQIRVKKTHLRKRVIGTVDEYHDAESARRSVSGLIHKINAANPRIALRTTTLAQLSDHF